MQEFMQFIKCNYNTSRNLASVAGLSGYGTTVRGEYDDLTVTIYAPTDGNDPLPWGVDGPGMAAMLREIRCAQG